MVRLLLLRHAKSSWDGAGVPDHDRPLNVRGRAAAPQMGRHMADHALKPDLVLCSSARRTRETLAGLMPHLSGDFDVRVRRRVYDTSDGDYVPILRAEGGKARTLLLVGHNPTIQSTALALIGRGNPELVEKLATKFPTAGLAVIDFDTSSWDRLEPGTGRVVAVFQPRELEVVDRIGEAGADD